MEKTKKQWGGKREGSGRPRNTVPNYSMTFRISESNKKWLETIENRSTYINELIDKDRLSGENK